MDKDRQAQGVVVGIEKGLWKFFCREGGGDQVLGRDEVDTLRL